MPREFDWMPIKYGKPIRPWQVVDPIPDNSKTLKTNYFITATLEEA
jgi:hypothetical protein